MDQEQRLLEQAQQLDEDALGEIFDLYYRPVYRYIYQSIRHVQTTEDLSAKVFQKLLEALHSGKGPERRLKAWLFRVAHNIVIDETRRFVHRNHSMLQDNMAAHQPDIELVVHHNLLAEQVHHAMHILTPQQRSVIALRFLEGMDSSEIAHILETTVGAVKALQHRGLAALRRHLAGEGEVS